MTEKGGMLPRRATGVCNKSQKELQDAIHKAQRAGMLLVIKGKLSLYSILHRLEIWNVFWKTDRALTVLFGNWIGVEKIEKIVTFRYFFLKLFHLKSWYIGLLDPVINWMFVLQYRGIWIASLVIKLYLNVISLIFGRNDYWEN